MNRSKGFTLIELMIVIVLMGILCGLASRILTQTFRAWLTAKSITSMENKVNIAMETVIREIKSAQGLIAIDSSSVTFINQAGDSIQIGKNGTNLQRSVNNAGAQTICNQIATTRFSWFDQTLASTPTAANVRFLTLQLVATDNQGLPFTLMAGTVLRKHLN